MNTEEKNFWKQLIKKSFVMFGFTYFSVCVSLNSFTTIVPSILASGLYFFTELVRYYELNPEKKKAQPPNKKINNKTKTYSFLI